MKRDRRRVAGYERKAALALEMRRDRYSLKSIAAALRISTQTAKRWTRGVGSYGRKLRGARLEEARRRAAAGDTAKAIAAAVGVSSSAIAAAVREGRIPPLADGRGRARKYGPRRSNVDKVRRAIELRRARVPILEIMKILDVGSEATIVAWTRQAATHARLVRGDALEQAARLLASGVGTKGTAAAVGLSDGSIRNAIAEGRLPRKGPTIVACSACGREFEAPSRNALGAACSSICRRALTNASKIAVRWRARGRRVTARTRELMIAQSLLRIETREGRSAWQAITK